MLLYSNIGYFTVLYCSLRWQYLYCYFTVQTFLFFIQVQNFEDWISFIFLYKFENLKWIYDILLKFDFSFVSKIQKTIEWISVLIISQY